MAHMPPSTAIFSPSVARLAAATAKDWNYIDSWLSAKFHGRTPPPFERNPDTLKALLALAALNESADEERDLVARVEAEALRELKGDGGDGSQVADASQVAAADHHGHAIAGRATARRFSAVSSRPSHVLCAVRVSVLIVFRILGCRAVRLVKGLHGSSRRYQWVLAAIHMIDQHRIALARLDLTSSIRLRVTGA